jgi:hypothetical protein
MQTLTQHPHQNLAPKKKKGWSLETKNSKKRKGIVSVHDGLNHWDRNRAVLGFVGLLHSLQEQGVQFLPSRLAARARARASDRARNRARGSVVIMVHVSFYRNCKCFCCCCCHSQAGWFVLCSTWFSRSVFVSSLLRHSWCCCMSWRSCLFPWALVDSSTLYSSSAVIF